MFQKSLEAVLDRLGDAERGQSTLNTIGANANNESDIQVFRNQLKVSWNMRSEFEWLVELEKVP